MRKEIAFFLAGLLGGLITAAAAPSWPTLVVAGAGVVFFIALLAAIAATGSWSRLRQGAWRYVVAGVVSTVAYVLALLTFSGLGGYSPDLFGLRASSDVSDFGADIWIGLLAAAIVAAICIELVGFVLTGRWSNAALARLAGAGFLAIMVTFAGMRVIKVTASMPALYYWSFLGILFPVGEGLFCAIVGAQIWRSRDQGSVSAI